MNILYYIPGINQQMGGIKQYTEALLRLLAKDRENQYFIYHEAADPEIMSIVAANQHLVLLDNNNKAPWRKYAGKIRRRLSAYLKVLSEENRRVVLLKRLCRNYQIDIVHCPYQYLPPVKAAKIICTMHDVQEIHFPEYFSAEERANRATNYLHYIKNSNAIIVSYQHVKQDLVKYFATNPDKIRVCLLEMNNLWLDKYSEKDIVSLDGLGVRGDFIFYPANTWQHKNHLGLIEAVAILKGRGVTNIKLVCTGYQTPYFERQLAPLIRHHGLQEQVLFPGVVDELSLYTLYKKAIGVVVPTKYEAGSFPLMEAMLLDVPVICANVTSLPDTIGDKDYLFDPGDTAAIADKLYKLWSDAGFRKENIRNSQQQSGRLRATNALKIIKGTYRDLIFPPK